MGKSSSHPYNSIASRCAVITAIGTTMFNLVVFWFLLSGTKVCHRFALYYEQKLGNETSANTDERELAVRNKPICKLPDFSGASTFSANKLKIPKILHQTWKTADTLPPKYAKYRQTWLEMHPNWTHHLWTDEENRELVRCHYSWLLEAYDNFPVGVMRADTSHYLQMHQYGGMYADLDMEPLRPLDFLIDNASHPVTTGYMRDSFQDISNVQPGFLISEPGHPLWLLTAIRILAASQTKPRNTRPDFITGPVLFYLAIKDYTALYAAKNPGSIEKGSPVVHDLRILEPGLIYPYHWSQHFSPVGSVCDGQEVGQNETACKAMFPNAYTIQYSAYSWKNDWETFLEGHGMMEGG